jgi:hypothetical protein
MRKRKVVVTVYVDLDDYCVPHKPEDLVRAMLNHEADWPEEVYVTEVDWPWAAQDETEGDPRR